MDKKPDSYPPFRWADLFWFVLIVAGAAALRGWYLDSCVGEKADVPFRTQDPAPVIRLPVNVKVPGVTQPTEQDLLIHNLVEHRWFGTLAPLSPQEEATAHVAPGYPYFVALLRNLFNRATRPLIPWVQVGLGALTCGLYYFFARWAFHSFLAGLLTGLLCAFHPLWIFNVAEIQDGTLTSSLLALALVLGVRSAQTGNVFGSLLLGITLAALALTRAAMLPFALAGLVWFLARCTGIKGGWLGALVAFLGFVNGVAPWTVRNWQHFDDLVPIVDSAWLHLWLGNNPASTGTILDEDTLRQQLGPKRLKELQAEPKQARRYQRLAQDVVQFGRQHPEKVVYFRLRNLLFFALGGQLFDQGLDEQMPDPWRSEAARTELPEWLQDNYRLILYSVLLGMLLLVPLGWRWSHGWRKNSGIATLAVLLIPLPYLLGHAEHLWGPRLPLDGVLLSYAALALLCLLPGLGKRLRKGEERAAQRSGKAKEKKPLAV